jgi:hypothetical protein
MAESIEPGFYEGVKALNVGPLLQRNPASLTRSSRSACSKMWIFAPSSAAKWMGRVFDMDLTAR